jgi:hypothetical protein
MEDSGRFYGHLVNFQTIWYILLHYVILCGHFVYFPRFGILYHERSGNPELDHASNISNTNAREPVQKSSLCTMLTKKWSLFY